MGAGTIGSMGSIELRRLFQRNRRRVATLAVLLVCSTAIAMHHSGMATGDAHQEMGMGAVVEMCLAAFTAVGAAVAAVGLGLIGLGRWRPATQLFPTAAWWGAQEPAPRARAGPALLLLLCVSRR